MNYSQKKKFRMTAVFLLALLFAACINTKWVSAADYTTSAVDLQLSDTVWTSDQWITETNTEQYYRIQIPSDGKVTCKVMAYGFVHYELRNEDLSKEIHWDNSYNGAENSPVTGTMELALSKGTYYLKVSQISGYTGKYKVNASFRSYNATDENAVSYDSPQDISLDAEVVGALTEQDTADWYRIRIPSTGYYHYRITAYTNVGYQLYNEDLSVPVHSEEYSRGTESSPKTDTYDVALTAGTYYFKVFRGDTGKYSFVFNALSPASCNHEYQDTYVEPTYTRKGYTNHKCTKCGRSYKDNYRAKLILDPPSLHGPSVGKRSLRISWSPNYESSGYQILYRINGTKKIVKVAGAAKSQRVLKGLKSKKVCTYQIRAYKKVGNQTVYSKWTPKSSVRIQ